MTGKLSSSSVSNTIDFDIEVLPYNAGPPVFIENPINLFIEEEVTTKFTFSDITDPDEED
jgi:hypothetical protein